MKAVGRGQWGQISVEQDRVRVVADGVASASITLHFSAAPPEGGRIQLKLNKLGSFSPNTVQREIEVPVSDGQARVEVFAPRRPGAAVLTGEGFKLRLEFTPVSFVQSLLYEWGPTLGVSLVIALFLRSFVVASYYIPSGSMENTLLEHDLLIADKLSYKLLHQGPRRGDVMIFQYPMQREQDYIKRTIGLPGDTIEVRDGTVIVNEVPLDEPYIKEHPAADFGPVTVPAEHYFMMGDNRNHSSDSRVWGFVPKSYFEGRALFVFFPFNRNKLITNDLLAQDKVIPPGSAMAAEPSDGGEAAAASK